MSLKERPERNDDPNKKIVVIFYRTEAGGEPVREWLKSLSATEKRQIGEDIKTVEFGWPIGMPVCRPLKGGLFEVRTTLPNRIARIIFYIDKLQRMVLLHGFIKKSQRLDDEDLNLAKENKNKHQRGMR